MNHTSYPLSESDGGTLYYSNCHSTVASNDLEYRNNWPGNTVEKEVIRGKKLRKEKMQYPYGQSDVMNIDFFKLAPYTEKNRYQRNYSTKYREKKNPCSPRSVSSYPRSNSPRSCAPFINIWRPNSAQACQRKCPMRIAELAVPSKRQCIDTWRNKCDVLPRCMVERLRQQVMDQRPIVDISEAIYCFKKRKSITSNSGWDRSCKKMSFKEKRQAAQIMELRRFCAVFGQRIAKKLMTPLEITLKPELARISEVVTEEIADIICNQKRIYYGSVENKSIHTEVSNKVAIWISNILEDSSHRLLQEDLRELEEEEGPVLDFIDDLVDIVVSICNPNASDFNEECGSINSGFDMTSKEDNTFDEQCEIHSESSGSTCSSSSHSRESVTDKNLEHESQNSLLVPKVTQTQGVEDTLTNSDEVLEGTATIEDHIKKELINMIGNITKDLTIEDNLKIEDEHVTEFDNIQNEIEQGIDSKTRIEITDSANITTFPEVQNVDNLDIADESNGEIKHENMLNQKSDSGVSEVFEILSEDSHEDKNKKVKFSDTNMVTQGEGIAVKSDTYLLEDKIKNELEQISQKPSLDGHINPNIVFSSPNENLLSDADETWPENIASPVLKASESVSKSITSLGKILESDEKLQMLPEDDTNIKDPHEISVGNIKSDLETINKIDIREKYKEDDGKITSITNKQNIDEINEPLIEQNIIKGESKNKYINSSKGSINIEEEIVSNQNENVINVITNLSEIKEVDQKQENKGNPIEIPDLKTGKDAIPENTKSPKSKVDSKIFGDKLADSFIANNNNKTNYLERNIYSRINDGRIDSAITALKILEVIKEQNTVSKPKNDYKVHPNTAPSWVSHGCGEPSDDSLYVLSQNKCKKIKEYKIRKWGKDLEHGYKSLEMWNDWISTTCKSISYLQKNRCLVRNVFYADKTAREWLKLKKNIDNDVLFWIKFNQRTQERQKNRMKFQKKSKVASVEHCQCKPVNIKTGTQDIYKCRKF